jgi:hypothetical protein
MLRSRAIAHLSVAVFLVLMQGRAPAQESRATIGGRVSDAAGAVISGAVVKITNVDTSIETSLTTNDSGAYVAPLLIPGNYRIAAEHPGFKRFSRTGITLSVNDNLQIDVKLDVGEWLWWTRRRLWKRPMVRWGRSSARRS